MKTATNVTVPGLFIAAKSKGADATRWHLDLHPTGRTPSKYKQDRRATGSRNLWKSPTGSTASTARQVYW